MVIILSLRRLTGDQKFKLILSYMENSKPEKFLLYHV